MENCIDIDELPKTVVAALKDIGYHRKYIDIVASETTTMSADSSGDGFRAFTMAFNLETGGHETIWGSWGGPNMFNQKNLVDLDRTPRVIGINMLIIKGHTGGNQPVFATIYVHPTTMNEKLLPKNFDVTDEEKIVLAAFRGLQSFARAGFAESKGIGAKRYGELISSLVAKKLLKRNRAGATSITAEGRCASGDTRCY